MRTEINLVYVFLSKVGLKMSSKAYGMRTEGRGFSKLTNFCVRSIWTVPFRTKTPQSPRRTKILLQYLTREGWDMLKMHQIFQNFLGGGPPTQYYSAIEHFLSAICLCFRNFNSWYLFLLIPVCLVTLPLMLFEQLALIDWIPNLFSNS